ncbi:mucin-5AC isoform X1 [Dendroctonus ponderosae]|uniref:mucin-5AC isoform X1 n=1 Tax=Dendroctonus ponderosae TaxID=77166 RepID=UPI0020350509|nr:mucin-5AC isoform X1 [Dendroctonus ponderosae]
MNFLFFLLLALCLVEIHSQRSRTSNTNEEPAPSRTRGRARFSAAEVLAEQSTPATANRRASTRTRIHSNNPQAAAERRARPTEAPRSYEVEEINNDSPIDSFRRQSKSRVLTESRFEAPSRRPAIEVSSAAVTPAVADILPVDELGFGSTARAILQARGQTLPPKTTTPVVDEEYLLTNFGSTIRSLAAASRSAQASFAGKSNIPQRATVLRSEAPILTREDLRSSAPVPSVRASPERLAPSRSRPGSRAKPVEVRPAVEENVRAPAEEPEPVQGLSEAAELVTETQPLEISSEAQHLLEGAGGVFSEETSTLKSTTAQPNRVVSKGRRPSPRPSVVEYSPAPRLRSRVTTNRRPAQPSGETSSSRPRFSRRKLEDSIEAESSFRGPAVATVEQFEAATSRSRPGRKIDSKFERVPVDLTPESTTVRSRSSGRRATTSDPSSVERSNVGEKASRGRARSRTETPTASTSRSAGRRAEQRRPTETPNSKPSSSRRRGGSEEGSRRATNEDRSSRERSTTRREGSLVEAPARRKGGQSRFATQPQEAPSSRSRNPARLEESVEDTTVFYGEKSRSTDAPETSSSTTTTAKSAVERKPLKESFRSRSRFPISPPIIDETKLEVLPLFEREPKSLVSTRSRGRGRSSVSRRSSVDHMHVSATENDVKFVEKPTTSAFSRVTVTRAEPVEASTGRARLSTRVTSSTEAPKSSSPTPETTTRAKTSPRIKESVVSEVNQVISKSTITRRKKVSKAKAAEMLSRGNKKAELNPQEKSRSSEEDVGEEDNYPEPFKALIQAKKSKGEVRPTKPSLKSFTVTPKTSTTEKLVVTSTVSPRSSPSSARAITGIPKRSQDINEIINDNDNELDPKPKQPSTTSTTPRPTRPRQLPKFSEKNAKSRLSTKPTSASRKSYAPRNAVDHQVRRKTLRSTASPPPTTPLSVVTKETKFSAKFVKKETDGLSNGKTVGGPQPKGLYSSKRVDKEVEAIGVAQSPKPVQPIKKFNTSRYSSRYRLDTSSRSSVLKSTTSAPFYIPTIPTPAYVPTVPTLRPPVTPVDGVVAVTDDDLGVEVISFDDPVNSIASADLVNGEFLTTDKNLKLTATAKDGTTEKAVSIIERIINSITMISTTEAPNTSTSNLPPSSPNAASENSAILKLATKKTTPKDKTTPDIQTNIIETITSEKPTTIIEKIRSSLTAIQTNEVGTSNLNTVSSSSTTPLSTVTKYSAKFRGSSVGTTALPAPLALSTPINPLTAFPDIDQNEVLEKRTIGKLLDILNGLVSTNPPADQNENLVVVTPKSPGFVSTTFSPQEPIEAVTFDGLQPRFTDVSTAASLVVNTTPLTTSTAATTVTDVNTESSTLTQMETTTTPAITTTAGESGSETTSSLPLTTTTDLPTTTTTASESTTVPTIPMFQVSPGSVSIFSANDLVNSVTVDDNLFNTVTIAGRVGFDNNLLTSTETTESATTVEPSTSPGLPTTDMGVTTLIPTEGTTEVDSSTTLTNTPDSTTVILTTTTTSAKPSPRSGRILSSDVGEPIGNSLDVSTPSTTTSTTPDYFIFAVLNNNTILRKRPPTIPNKDTPFIVVGLFPNNTVVRKFPNGTLVPMDPVIKVRGFDIRPNPPPLVEITSNQVTDTTNGMTPLDNNSATVESNRMSRLLATEQQPTSTSIVTVSAPSTTTLAPLTTASTTVSTSTVLPSTSTMQTASTTVEPGVVRIMAIPGEMRISKALETTTQAESSTTQPSTMATSTMWQSTETIPPTLGEILNGRTVDALNNLIKLDATSTTTQVPNFKTLQVNQYNEVLNIQDLINRNNGNVIYRWKPVTKAEYKSIKNSLALSTAEPSTVTTLQTSETMAPFTSPILSTEKTTFVPTTDDLLFTSTLMSTLAPASTTTPEPTTQSSTTTTSTTTTTTTTTTTPRPTTTTTTTTTTQRPTTTKRVETTTRKLMSTTGFPSFTPSGILPTFLTTLFPNLIRGTISPQENSRPVDVSNSLSDRFEVLAAAGTTARPTVILSQSPSTQRISTTTPTTTTTTSTTTTTTTTQAPPPTTETPTTTTPKPKPASTKEDTDKLFEELKKSGKLNNLNEEQKRNLAEIEKIEKEQAALLKQLSLLTTMFAPPNVRAPTLSPMPNPLSASSSSLANRVIAMAMERDRSRSMTTTQEPQTTTKRRPNSIQDQLPITHVEDATKKTTPSLEDILKQYNLDGLSTPAPLTSTYGKTDEALLAAILKEHGIGPTTPKILGERVKEAGIFEEAPTTKKPKPKSRPIATTSRPVGGRLMQGLNWLLDILDPPTTKKPTARKAPSKPAASKPNAADDEILSNQPTRITPMVTAAPVTKPSLTQDEIQGLIKQLEAVQNDPDAADQLDFSKIKSLQNLINVNEGVQVTHTGQHGATSRATPRPPRVRSSTEKDRLLAEINRRPKASTISTLSVSNSIDDDDEDEDASSISTTTRTRVMPPVSLNPIPGIDDQGDSMIRSNLLTAAVNVTRAISSFLGSAIQDAAQQVRSAFYTGSSGVLGGLSSGSNLSSIAGASFG